MAAIFQFIQWPTAILMELNFSVLSGPPNPPKVEIYLEKLAVNALVELSKGNVNAPFSNK